MSKLIKRKQLDLKLKAIADGVYGTGNIANIQGGDELESAFDKIVAVLDRMAPAMPPIFNTLTLTKALANTVAATTARSTADGVAHTNVHKFASNGVITWTTTGIANAVATRDGHFRDGDSSSAKLRIVHSYNGTEKIATIDEIDKILVGGTKMAEDLPNYNVKVTITEKKDYYSDDAGKDTKSNFYKSIKGAIAVAMATSVNDADILERTVKIQYSESGAFPTNEAGVLTLTGTYRIEKANTPSASVPVLAVVGGTMNEVVSGVPTLAQNQEIKVTSTISNAIKFYYPSTVGSSIVAGTSNKSNPPLTGAQTANTSFSYDVNHSVNANIYLESISGSIIPYDIFGNGTSVNALTLTNRRIDTKSVTKASTDATNRLLSPASNDHFGAISASRYTVAQHANTLATNTGVFGNALQLIDGKYQYPANVNYTNVYGAGGDFTNLTNFPAGQFRFVDFELGTVNNASFFLLNVTGLSSAINTNDLILLVRVDGAAPTGGDGWLDANGSYPSVGSPTGTGLLGATNARYCYDTSATLTNVNGTRRITFGSSNRTGMVTVRIGFKKGSSLNFTAVTKS
jgi:hypothetical protein